MAMKKDIEEVFSKSIEKYDIGALALTSKNGIPIASKLKKENEHESFSTLSATILGASEVIFSAFEKNQPEDILVKSNDSLLLIKETSSDSVIALLGNIKDEDELIEALDDISDKVKEIRENSSKIEVTQ
ncbi:MAG: roadblock/LC7 domain-containing protein [Thermoplasmatota archaeon]